MFEVWVPLQPTREEPAGRKAMRGGVVEELLSA